MSAQTEGRDPNRVASEAIPVKSPTPLDVAAAVTIYGGSLVFVNSSGRAVALSPDQTMSCAGYAENDVDNSAGSNGTLTITPRIGCISLVNGDAIVAADVGKMAFASDNQTANLSSSSNTRCPIGPIIGLDGSRVFVLTGYPLAREVASYTSLSSIPVLTSTASGSLSAEVNMGALSDGLLAVDVTGGVAAFNSRSIAVSGAGLSIANADGQAGNPTLSLGNGLAALEALASTGIVVHTAADTYTERSLAAPAAGFTITDPSGVAGNPTFVLADDLGALEALDATAGLLAKTAANAYARRTLTAPAAGITVSNGDGQAGNPTLALANDLAALEALDATAGLLVKTGAETYNRRSIAVGSVGLSIANADGSGGNPTLDNLFAPIELADPGTAQPIPVTRSQTVMFTVGAGVETNTLAIPAFVGQKMILAVGSIAGGTRAVTAASAINVAGNTIMTFNAARDNCHLHAVRVGGVLAWEIGFNASVLLS